MRITIIGLGGVGTWLVRPVAQMLATTEGEHTLTLVDGDSYEARNRNRQDFRYPGNKAAAKARELGEAFSTLKIVPVAEYCGPENIDFLVIDGEIVCLCVDNHPTRRFISEYAQANCADIALVNGGNELEDGDVIIYCRKDGQDVTLPLHALPEIANATGKRPDEMSCEELAAAGSAPQILPTNLTCATTMVNCLWRLMVEPEAFTALNGAADVRDRPYSRTFFDIRPNQSRSRWYPAPVPTVTSNEEEAA